MQRDERRRSDPYDYLPPAKYGLVYEAEGSERFVDDGRPVLDQRFRPKADGSRYRPALLTAPWRDLEEEESDTESTGSALERLQRLLEAGRC
eukprot:gene12861-3575_t